MLGRRYFSDPTVTISDRKYYGDGIHEKIDYSITVIFEKTNGNTVIQNLERPPYKYQVNSIILQDTVMTSSYTP